MIRRRIAILPLLLLPWASSGCYGPCGAPIILAPVVWLATPQQKTDPPTADPLPLKVWPASEGPVDIRPAVPADGLSQPANPRI
jgi:hypothetical protein